MDNGNLNTLPILIVDDEELWLHGISLTLERFGGFNNIIQCQRSLEVMDILSNNEVGLILLDLVMPELSGEQLLATIGESYPEIPVIVITGMNQAEIGLKCMKLGAFDFFVKTVGKDELIACINRALRLLEMRNLTENLTKHFFSENLAHPEAFSQIITQDPRMKSIFRYIEAVNQSHRPLLINGESGTGKEMIARAAHQVSRPEDPFVSINVAGLDDNVFSDTLFGHVKGAFTGAENDRIGLIKKAGKGVLFLDEIGDLSISSQTKLLRILQEREYMPLGSDDSIKTDARFFFSTNKDLEQEMKNGKFRKDLYYRIKTHHIYLPPLRERLCDLPLLLNFFVDKASSTVGVEVPRWRPKVVDFLQQYRFPGNVRELGSIIFDAVCQSKGGFISIESVLKSIEPGLKRDHIGNGGSEIEHANLIGFPVKLPTIRQMNKILIEEAMQRSNGNQTSAAGLLGISQPSLSRRLKMIKEETTTKDTY